MVINKQHIKKYKLQNYKTTEKLQNCKHFKPGKIQHLITSSTTQQHGICSIHNSINFECCNVTSPQRYFLIDRIISFEVNILAYVLPDVSSCQNRNATEFILAKLLQISKTSPVHRDISHRM